MIIPITKNGSDLSSNIPEDVMRKLEQKDKSYIKFPMTKKNGGKRWIHAPHFLVKNAQRAILETIPNPSVMHFGYEVINGFVPGRSIIDNARPHVGKSVVLSIDLKNFFPSFTPTQIKHTTSKYGDSFQKLITTAKDKLPQGAPTSPMIANWAAIEGDQAVVEFCKVNGLNYTRYADDLTFSTSADYIDEFVVQDLLGIINNEFGPRLKAHPRKIKFMRKHKQQRVTGIVVNEKLSIPRARRRKLRAFMHDADKNGIKAALARENNSIHTIFGEFSFIHLAHKELAEKYIQQFKELL